MANSFSSNNFEDPGHHLLLHHSEHPGVVLVTQLFTEDNYQTWIQAIVMGLLVPEVNLVLLINLSTHQPPHIQSNTNNEVDATIS